ncbi:MAG: UDP-N-acetylglucosamine 2-epimerase (non-hydrolyzing) [Ignavibacteriae bacterium]|nr:MAG: UDP-N-acetylglucosamine 2-epimerase (non-hydrolyzing) [Ignavibacteriota bacterium]
MTPENLNISLLPENFKNKKVIVIVFGTRPEIIKLFVLYRILKKSEEFFPILYNTAQQKISSDILSNLGLSCDIIADEIPNRTTDLNQLVAHLLNDFNKKFGDNSPIKKENLHGVIVQGDTASAYAGAIWSFFNQIPVFHVEAGLRTLDKLNPFPEEFVRESIARTATIHFCPKGINRDNLINEGIRTDKVYVIGNTINDAIFTLIKEKKIKEPKRSNFILSTLHRRENWNNVMTYAKILNTILNGQTNYTNILHIMHPNPLIQKSFETVLNGKAHEHLVLMEPIHDYFEMLGYVKKSGTILTDSGGLQEESLFFNVPCGVLRKTTERPEVLKKNAKLLPFETEEISSFLKDATHYREMHKSKYNYTYGFGDSSYLIYELLKKYFCIETTFTF